MVEERGRVLVPVKVTGQGHLKVWSARTPDGSRVGVGFTSHDRLRAALGEDWADRWSVQWLGRGMLRSLLAPLGVRQVVIDPDLVLVQQAGAPVLALVPPAAGRIDDRADERAGGLVAELRTAL